MKVHYLLAPLAAIALVGCTVYRPVAYTTPVPVAVSPTYVVPSTSTTILGAAPARDWGLMDSDGDGYSNAMDRYPYNALFH
jgi:hypothetical protein